MINLDSGWKNNTFLLNLDNFDRLIKINIFI